MEQTKDYSLLRLFDLEAAKAGEIVQWYQDNSTLEYIGPSTSLGEAGCFKWLSGEDTTGTYEGYKAEQLRMAPLAWVEGKPVYKGDVLYQYYAQDHKNRLVTISNIFTNGIGNYLTFTEGGNWAMDGNTSKLTWNKPKVKKSGWMNSYDSGENYVYPTKDRADVMATHSRKACIEILWEE